MIVCHLNHHEQNIPGFARFGSVLVNQSLLPFYNDSDRITLLWRGQLYNRPDLLRFLNLSEQEEGDEPLLVALYQRVGMYELLRLINADFTTFLLWDANIYGSEALLYMASPLFPTMPLWDIHDDFLSLPQRDGVPTVTQGLTMPISSLCVWRKSFQVFSEWKRDLPISPYFLPPLPIQDDPGIRENIDAVIHNLSEAAIRKKWAIMQPPVVHLYQHEESHMLFAFLQTTLLALCEVRVVVDLQEVVAGPPIVFFCISLLEELRPYEVVFPFQERDLYQVLALLS